MYVHTLELGKVLHIFRIPHQRKTHVWRCQLWAIHKRRAKTYIMTLFIRDSFVLCILGWIKKSPYHTRGKQLDKILSHHLPTLLPYLFTIVSLLTHYLLQAIVSFTRVIHHVEHVWPVGRLKDMVWRSNMYKIWGDGTAKCYRWVMLCRYTM